MGKSKKYISFILIAEFFWHPRKVFAQGKCLTPLTLVPALRWTWQQCTVAKLGDEAA